MIMGIVLGDIIEYGISYTSTVGRYLPNTACKIIYPTSVYHTYLQMIARGIIDRERCSA